VALHAAVAAWNQRESSWPRRVEVGKQGGTKGGRLQGEVIAVTADASVVAARWWREMDGGR
jgi:threonine aldolase